MTLREVIVAILSGIVQGIVEWLPISSTGNLSLFLTVVGTEPELALQLALFLQAGTTLSATLYYRETIRDAVEAAPGWRPRTAFEGSNAETTFVVVACVVTGLVGVPLYLLLIDVARDLTGGAFIALIGVLLVVTGAIQQVTESVGLGDRSHPNLFDAIVVGALQGISILPGVSRSGATASALLFRGHDGTSAFRLSFLLSIPAGIGAGMLVLVDTGGVPTPTPSIALVALTTSAVVGYVAISALMRVVDAIEFSHVCFGLGALCIVGGGLTALA
ncbi:undecaprenyl-diphosphate phosphatase [Natronorubrum sp. FCH18a]|uniref:undecaprenyl-diphosphate phosphatase n=1 Tax=Natronorubrum sp. FCH18a TaxID=3447018 RepID=UPI003F50D6B4